MLIAELRDFNTPDELHNKVRPAGLCRPCIKHPGDVWMVHQRKRLPLGFEARDNAFGVHTQLDDFQGHPPPHWLLLFRHVNHTASTLADLFEQFVAPDAITQLFMGNRNSDLRADLLRRLLQKIADASMGLKQRFYALAKRCVTATRAL